MKRPDRMSRALACARPSLSPPTRHISSPYKRCPINLYVAVPPSHRIWQRAPGIYWSTVVMRTRFARSFARSWLVSFSDNSRMYVHPTSAARCALALPDYNAAATTLCMLNYLEIPFICSFTLAIVGIFGARSLWTLARHWWKSVCVSVTLSRAIFHRI